MRTPSDLGLFPSPSYHNSEPKGNAPTAINLTPPQRSQPLGVASEAPSTPGQVLKAHEAGIKGYGRPKREDGYCVLAIVVRVVQEGVGRPSGGAG